RRPVHRLRAEVQVRAEDRPEEGRLGGDEQGHAPPAGGTRGPWARDGELAHASSGSRQCHAARLAAASAPNSDAMTGWPAISMTKTRATQSASTTGQGESEGISSTSSNRASRTVEDGVSCP